MRAARASRQSRFRAGSYCTSRAASSLRKGQGCFVRRDFWKAKFVRGRGGSCNHEMKERFPRLSLLFCCPPCTPAAAPMMLCVLCYVRARVVAAVRLHSSWTAPNWAPTSIRRARVLKQSTPWQPCCAGALLLQFARHTQHTSAARRQRRRRWPNRARASRGAPSPSAPTMIALLTAGCAGANFHRKVHQCEHWYS